tara:strand:+ start:217 stop:384 length:168 start_codon:yes stop_codon:yes gene_type:complete
MEEIVSPCIDKCTLNKDGICIGCGRVIDEISDWNNASDEQKMMIINSSKKRLELI